MRNATLNTVIFFVYVITLLLYWTNILPELKENVAMYAVSSVVMGLMVATYFFQAAFAKMITRTDYIILGVFTILLAGHTYYSETTTLQALNILAVFYLYMVFPKIAIHTQWVYRGIFGGFIVMALLFLPSVWDSVENRVDEYSGFLGIFDSSNNIGTLGTIALFCYLLYQETHKKRLIQRQAIIFFILVVVFSSHQRAALLMLAVWFTVYYLMKMGMSRALVFTLFVMILGLVGAYVVQIETVGTQELFGGYEMFGKEASTRGRSEQINAALSTFDITAWGEGRGIVNSSVIEDTRYAVHNAFVVSLLEYGYLFFLLYIAFWFWVFKRGKNMAASFFLAYHVILFVEPENFFSNHLLTFLAFSAVLLSENDKLREESQEEEVDETESEEGETEEGKTENDGTEADGDRAEAVLVGNEADE